MMMVERVARAMAEAGECVPWDKMSRKGREVYTCNARAAIEAMREPTEAMLSAAEKHTDWDGNRVADSYHAGFIYEAMIAAALGEP